MSDKDTITLPREAVEKAIKAFENGCPSTCENGMIDSGGFHPWSQPALVPCPACLAFEHLRTALAAEPTKPEPVATVGTQSNAAWKGYDGRWSPPGDPIKVVHLLRDLPLGTLLYTAPPENEALRRDAERYRWLRERAWFQFEFDGRYGDSGETVQELDAAIDAAMGDKR